MKMYELSPLDGQGASNMSSEAFIFNDVNIEQTIEGFRTLRVTGRDSYSKTLTSYTIGHRNKFLYRDYDAVDVQVYFQLTANDQYESEYRLASLKGLLRDSEQKYSFMDSQMYWIGTVTNFEIEDPATWWHLNGTITITNMTPFRYLPDRTLDGRVSSVSPTITEFVMTDPNITLEARLRNLTFRNGSAAQKIVINNYTQPAPQQMVFSTLVPANALVEIDFQELVVKVNSSENNNGGGWITLTSDFGNMTMRKGASMEIANIKDAQLTYFVEIL